MIFLQRISRTLWSIIQSAAVVRCFVKTHCYNVLELRQNEWIHVVLISIRMMKKARRSLVFRAIGQSKPISRTFNLSRDPVVRRITMKWMCPDPTPWYASSSHCWHFSSGTADAIMEGDVMTLLIAYSHVDDRRGAMMIDEPPNWLKRPLTMKIVNGMTLQTISLPIDIIWWLKIICAKDLKPCKQNCDRWIKCVGKISNNHVQQQKDDFYRNISRKIPIQCTDCTHVFLQYLALLNIRSVSSAFPFSWFVHTL